MKKSIDKIYVFIAFGALLPMLINGPSDLRDFSTDRTQALNLIYFIFSLVYLVPFLIKPIVYSRDIFWLAFPALFSFVCFFSALWSEFAFRSAAIGYFLLTQVIACSYFVNNIGFNDLMMYVKKITLAILILSLVFIFLIPSYGKMTYIFPGAWQGVFVHKNVLGRFCVFAYSVGLFFYWRDKDLNSIIVIFFSLFLGLGCESATALIGIFLTTVVFFMLKNKKIFFTSVIGFVILTALVIIFWDAVVEFLALTFNKSITLSGRTTLWSEVFLRIGDKPFFGYGAGGFWGTDVADEIRYVLNWYVPHAHNGVLEIAVQVGYVGAILFSLMIFISIWTTFDVYRKFGINCAGWQIMFLVGFLVYGVGEANYGRPNSFVHFFVILISGYNCKLLSRR